MSKEEVVVTLFGKNSKYEVVKKTVGLFYNPTFSILKDGKPHGSFNSLRAAVDVAEKESGDKR